MSDAEKLLDSLTEVVHEHDVVDTDVRFTIDPFSRTISSSNGQKTILIQGDHKSERFTFEIPRYIEGHDMLLCDVVRIPYINSEVDGRNPKYNIDVHTVGDLQVDPKNDKQLIFSWTVSDSGTMYEGVLTFSVVFLCLNGKRVTYRFGTDVYENMFVRKTPEIESTFELRHLDIIEQWKDEVRQLFTAYIDSEVDKHIDVAREALSEELTNDLDEAASLLNERVTNFTQEVDVALAAFNDILETEITTMGNNIDVLESRMDTFTALKEGSTTGDAELADIRVGADGKIYPTAGDAVREQTKNILGLFTVNPVFEQGTIASGTGENTNNILNRIRTGFILADNFLSVTVDQTFIVSLFQYKGDFTFLSTSGWVDSLDNSTLEDDCRFIRIAVARRNSENLTPDVETGFVMTAVGSPVRTARIDALDNTHATLKDRLEYDFNNLYKFFKRDVEFKMGSITANNGKNTDADTRIRTDYLKAAYFAVKVGSDYRINLFQYTTDYVYISTTGFTNYISPEMLDEDCSYIRFVVCRGDERTITLTEETGFELYTFAPGVDDVEFAVERATEYHDFLRIPLVFESGTVSSTDGTDTDNVKRIRTGYLTSKIDRVIVHPHYLISVFQYDSEHEFLSSSGFLPGVPRDIITDDCMYIRVVLTRVDNKDIHPDEGSAITVYGCLATEERLYEESVKIKNSQVNKYKFNDEIMNTAYSSIGLAPINTAEHFHLAAHLGFNSLKGDVRITADGKLIMCHDAGFTLDGDGRIGAYDGSNSVAIIESNYNDLIGLEYATSRETLGHYATVCDFDTFIRICKETGKIAYITLRENDIVRLVDSVMKTLRKYRMVDRCVVNSYTFDTLKEVRRYTNDIPVSLVISLGMPLTTEIVDKAILLGNSIVTMFLYPTDNPIELWDQSTEAVEYALTNDVQIHMAQVGNYSDYSAMIRRGVQGFHILKPFLTYGQSDIQFTVTVNSGKAWFGNILNSTRYSADISMNNGVVTLTNIIHNGSGYGYDDGLPMLWLNRLPYEISVNCKTNSKCSVEIKNGSIELDTSNVNGIYNIRVRI